MSSPQYNLVHFARNNVFIQHPQQGRVPFDLYNFQKNFLLRLQSREYYIVSKARQMGLNNLFLTLSLWLMIYNRDYNILVVSTNHDMSKHIHRTFEGLHIDCTVPNKPIMSTHRDGYIELNNGSSIDFWAISKRPNIPQKEFDFVIVDEAAYMENNDMEWLQKHIESGRKIPERMIIVSTPSSSKTWFDHTFMRALRGQNKFIPMQLDWELHPDRNPKWRNEQNKLHGEKDAQIQFDGNVKEISKTV